jgi:hypothetical protein
VYGPAEPRIADVELQACAAKLALTWIVTLLATSAPQMFAANWNALSR